MSPSASTPPASARDTDGWFRALFENSADAMALLDPETRTFVDCNEASARAIHASSRQALIGRRPEEMTAATQPGGRESAALITEIMAKVLREGSHRFEWRMRRLDGSETWSEIVATAITLNGRQLILTTSRNIDERKQMEQEVRQLNATLEQRIVERTAELRASEERFRRVYELSRLGICVVRWDGGYVEVNPAYCAMLGYQRDELVGGSLHQVTPPENRERDLQALNTLKEAGFLTGYRKEYLRKDGRRIHVVMNSVVVRVPDGEDEIWAFVEDITERTHAERQLRKSEASYRALFEASSQGVMINDETQFLEVNAAAARLFGCSREEIIGRHPRDLAAPFQPNGEPSDQAADRHIATCLREGQTRFEWLSRRADGSDFPLDIVLTSIEMGGRKVIQAMVTDISERKRAEEELKRALEHERELGLLKSNFVSMVSHEFRTPLGIIQSSAEILDDYLDQLSAAERREQLTSIIRNARRMAGLMEEVLVLGRLDADRMQFQPAPLDLAALCRRLVDEVHSSDESGVRIEFFTATLPHQVLADERLLRHVLLNLLTNAVKYSEPGQTVSFHARGGEGSVEFVIRDQGIGIPETEQRQLFTAFQRGSNVGQRPGTGLGLVIVKRCLDLHGGGLALASRPGQGTTATVSLPLTPCPIS